MAVSVKTYLLSLPERLARSAIGLGAGVVREIGELAIPTGIRRSELYQNLVDATLRFLIEEVGGVDGVYAPETKLTEDFLMRRTAGNVLEMLGIVAFRASPVWVLAALADACGAGKFLVPEIAAALAADGLLEPSVRFTSVEQILDALERTSSRLAATFNTPPLDVATLRQEWQAIRDEVRSIPPGTLPTAATLRNLWSQLKSESVRQHRSIFEMSSILALSAVSKFPDRLRWASTSARVAARRTGEVFATALLDHYRQTLDEVRQFGFGRYAVRQCRPYVRAAAAQLSPARGTVTERLLAGRVRLADVAALVGRTGLAGRVGRIVRGSRSDEGG
jgi:hypothetical protein